jgi:hypothetical protein
VRLKDYFQRLMPMRTDPCLYARIILHAVNSLRHFGNLWLGSVLNRQAHIQQSVYIQKLSTLHGVPEFQSLVRGQNQLT